MPVAIPGLSIGAVIRYFIHFRKHRKYNRLLDKQTFFIKGEIARRCLDRRDISSIYIAVLVVIWRDIKKDIGVEEVYLLNVIDDQIKAFYSDYDHFYRPSFS
ncbi:MAG TPA: hypothetical protein VL547_23870 [Dinghuibacter sp.]|jgi:hypothetical protein|uniref:hypothetical protein n=1 Tax=Dinghuibacter sp. TaxID=2024697 RepID=UPI002C35CCD6|nr:hypothetical protein [Dinghuibacter sp.]HTJ15104.1 hypothetical protein [Dinghuibacter sp.]